MTKRAGAAGYEDILVLDIVIMQVLSLRSLVNYDNFNGLIYYIFDDVGLSLVLIGVPWSSKILIPLYD